MTTLIEFAEKMKVLEDEMRNEGKSALMESFREFFSEFTEVSELRWCQYTPYFNDGDTCEFSVGDIVFFLDPESKNLEPDTATCVTEKVREEGEDRDDDYREGDGYVFPNSRKRTPREDSLVNAVRDINKTASKLEKLFLLAFGDHVKVKANRDRVEVEDYDHD